MSQNIVRWLGGHDTGSSSKAIALTALGEMPSRAEHSYPRDGADFGRCHRLLAAAPDARAGLEKLGADGGPYWKALYGAWDELTAAYEATGGEIRDRIRAIIDPIEDRDPGIVRLGKGVSMRFGGIR